MSLQKPLVETYSPQRLMRRDLQEPAVWMAQVDNSIQKIKEGVFHKTVLARALQVGNKEQTFDIAAYLFAIQRGERYSVGATPEQLLYGSDGQIRTSALAGSTPRGTTEEEDLHLGNELLQSSKNGREHQIVVTAISHTLAKVCSHIRVDDMPHLLKLKNIQHLETHISGCLLPDHTLLEALEHLHPTPAVGGFPRQSALTVLRANERLDRGWVGAHGNGEFAVALRCGLIHGNEATLFAGCEIVSDSQPVSEFAEFRLKFETMLHGLGWERGNTHLSSYASSR